MNDVSRFRQARQKIGALTTGAATRSAKIAAKAGEELRRLDESHEAIADHADSVAKASRVAAGVAAAGAVIAAPTGLTAVGVAVGVVSAPVITAVAPVLMGVAAVALTASAAASLYSKTRKRQQAARLTAPTSIESLARIDTMQEIELSEQERQGFEQVRAASFPDLVFELKATRLKADFGPVVEIVELKGPVHASYESPRVLRRLNTLRGLSHEQVEQVLARGT